MLPVPDANAPFTLFSQHRPRPIRWLCPGLIPFGKVTLLVGDPGVGKSFFSVDLAARITRGESLPPHGPLADGPGRALFLCANDDYDDTIHPRLIDAGANLDHVARMPNGDFQYLRTDVPPLISLAVGLEHIDHALRRLPQARLVVIDPISAYLAGGDLNNNVDAHRLLLRLSALARAYQVAILLISHYRKGGAPSALYRALGALAFTASARVVLTIVRDPAVEGRRLLLPVKMNLVPDDAGRAFTIRDRKLEWDSEPVFLNADQWQQSLRAGYATSDRTAETVDWLIELLQDGRVRSVEVHRLARERQVPRMLLFAAKKQAGAITYPDGCQGPWYWEIPKDEAPPEPDPRELPEYIMTDIGVPIINPEYARRLALG